MIRMKILTNMLTLEINCTVRQKQNCLSSILKQMFCPGTLPLEQTWYISCITTQNLLNLHLVCQLYIVSLDRSGHQYLCTDYIY